MLFSRSLDINGSLYIYSQSFILILYLLNHLSRGGLSIIVNTVYKNLNTSFRKMIMILYSFCCFFCLLWIAALSIFWPRQLQASSIESCWYILVVIFLSIQNCFQFLYFSAASSIWALEPIENLYFLAIGLYSFLQIGYSLLVTDKHPVLPIGGF